MMIRRHARMASAETQRLACWSVNRSPYRTGELPQLPRTAVHCNLRQRCSELWNALIAVRPRRILSYLPSREATERGARLLKENLTPAQRHQYDQYRYFEVTGGETGTQYRIRHGSQMNVERLDQVGNHVCTLCFVPEGSLVLGDIMLAQKIALELFESEAIAIANKMPANATMQNYPVFFRHCR